jgi:hypothetical protein
MGFLSDMEIECEKFERFVISKCPDCGVPFVWAKDSEFKTGESSYDGWAITFDSPCGLPSCSNCGTFSLGFLQGLLCSEGAPGDFMKNECDKVKASIRKEKYCENISNISFDVSNISFPSPEISKEAREKCDD